MKRKKAIHFYFWSAVAWMIDKSPGWAWTLYCLLRPKKCSETAKQVTEMFRKAEEKFWSQGGRA